MFDTDYPADSLEFCPTAGFHDLFVCGTYKLLDQQEGGIQKRRGQCLVFRMGKGDEQNSIKKVQSWDLPAIPDMKWYAHFYDARATVSYNSRSPRSSASPLLAIADSEGGITLLECQDNEGCLSRVESIQCASKNTLCLSLDWSNRRTGQSSLGSLIVSLSDGRLCLLTPSECSSLEVQETWHAHDYEPWVAAWNYWDQNMIYSGGDDLKLKGWDIRQSFTQPIFVNKRFEAGVTTIQSHPFVEHLVAVGSYDNTVRLFDIRKLSTPLTSTDVGGGAWRVKWHPSPSRRHDLLVACMHDGFKVIRFDLCFELFSGREASILKRHDEHESLAYGVDWSHAAALSDETVVGCCSFYDHKMSIWSA